MFRGSIQVGLGIGEQVKGRSVIDKIDCQLARAPTERDSDTARRKSVPVAMCNDVGEKLFENNEEPRAFVIGETTIASECLGKGFEPAEFSGLAAQGDRSLHRVLMRRNLRSHCDRGRATRRKQPTAGSSTTGSIGTRQMADPRNRRVETTANPPPPPGAGQVGLCRPFARRPKKSG